MALTPLSPGPSSKAANRLIEQLSVGKLTLAVAESLTGGLLALRVTQAPGSGELFRGGVVAYLTGVKHEVLGVPDGPVISTACAEAMAAGVARLLGADVALATTGVAGPEPQEGQPVGTAVVGYCIKGETSSHRLRLPVMDPDDIREATVDIGLTLLEHELDDRGST
jgi:PncC family amidohydrolase